MKKKLKCYSKYFINGHVFYTEEYVQAKKKAYNNEVCVKRTISKEFEIDYYEKLEEIIMLQCHTDQNNIFSFKCYYFKIWIFISFSFFSLRFNLLFVLSHRMICHLFLLYWIYFTLKKVQLYLFYFIVLLIFLLLITILKFSNFI